MVIRVFIVSVCVLLLSTPQVYGLSLHFQYSAEDGSGHIAADDYYALGETNANASDSFDLSDLRKPPPLPGAGTQIRTWVDATALIGDSRFWDAVRPRCLWPMELSILGGAPSETVQHTLTLLNPEVLANLPAGTLLYLRRYDASGTFAAYYDLTLSENHTILWQAEHILNPTALIDLVAIDGCLAANLDAIGSVNLNDFALFAEFWMQDGTYGTADIDGSGTADLHDIAIMAQHWLADCLH